jgi:hypothetical protein
MAMNMNRTVDKLWGSYGKSAISLKCQYISTRLQGTMSHKTTLEQFIVPTSAFILDKFTAKLFYIQNLLKYGS